MSKSLSRLLYLLSILFMIVGGLLLLRGYSHTVITPTGVTLPAHTVSATIGMILSGLAGLLALAAWVGALIKMALLHRWGWFVCLLLFSGLTLLLYIFFGPTTSVYPPMSTTTPPYGGFGD